MRMAGEGETHQRKLIIYLFKILTSSEKEHQDQNKPCYVVTKKTF